MQTVLPPAAMHAAEKVSVRDDTRHLNDIPDQKSVNVSSVEFDPSMLQAVIRAGRENAAPGDVVSFDLKVTNTSSLHTASEVRLMDMLPAGFRFRSGSVQINGTASSDPAVSTDGRALTFSVGTLAPGASSTVRFESEVTAGVPFDEAVSLVSVFSSAGRTSRSARATVAVSGDRRDSVSAVPPPVSTQKLSGQAPLEKSVQAATVAAHAVASQAPSGKDSPQLRVTIIAGRETVSPGESVRYDLTVSNSSDQQTASDVRIMDVLPAGFSFKKGSARLNGFPVSDPSISADSRALTFPVGTLAAGLSATVSFESETAAGSPPDRAVNFVSAFSSDSGTSKTAKAVVSFKEAKQETRTVAESLPEKTPPAVVKAAEAAVPAAVLSAAVLPAETAVSTVAPAPVIPLPETSLKPVARSAEPVTLEPASLNAAPSVDTLPPASIKAESAAGETVVAKSAAAIEPATTVTISPDQPLVRPESLNTVSADATPAVSPVVASSDRAAVTLPAQASLPADTIKSAATVEEPVSNPTAAVSAQVATPVSGISLPEPSQAAAVPADPPGNTRETIITDKPETRTLAGLVGVSDVPVLADFNGQFVKNMAAHRIIENESAGQVGETDLHDSIRSGRSFNRESHAALARSEQAKAQADQALALLLPSVSLHVNSGSETSSPSVAVDENKQPLASDTHLRTDSSLTVRQPLFDLTSYRDWRRRKVIEQARGENYRGSDGDAYLSTVNAYLTLVSSRLQIDMTRNFETQLSELLSYVEKRATAGAASISDMARVRARSQATLSARLEQESIHAAAGIEFVRLTNLVPQKARLPVLEDFGVSLLPKTFDSAVSEAMKANPDITALAAELQAAEIDKSVAKARYLPRIDAEYTDNYSLHAGGNPSSSGQRDLRVMAVLNWNLFSGGGDYKNHVERSERHKELQYRLDDQRRRIVQALSANYATLTTTRDRISSGYQELKSISTAADAMSKRMLSGNQSLLDLLDVYDRYYQVRSRLVSLHILEMSTVAQLVRLTRGTPERTL